MRKRTATVAFGGFVILGLPTGMLGVAWPSIRGELDAPLAGLGLVLAAMTLTEFGSSALSGIVRQRFGTLALLLLPTALAAGGLLLFTLAQTWSTGILAAALLGPRLAQLPRRPGGPDGVRGLPVAPDWPRPAAARPARAVWGPGSPAERGNDPRSAGAIASGWSFWILPPPIAALIALPSIGLSLSVFV